MNTSIHPVLTISTPECYILIRQNDIIYCQSRGNYTTFYLREKQITCSKKLKEVEPYLSPENFVRVHQSYLVNLQYVEKYHRKKGGKLELFSGTMIPVSRSRKADLLERINLI
jgi:two-component system LytT family response regulator